MQTLFGEYEELNPKIKQKKVIPFTSKMLEERLSKMEQEEGSWLDIIATYIRQKPLTIENSKQLSLVISRFCRIAKQTEGAYTNKQIFNAIKEIKQEEAERKRKGEVEIDWTIETLVKKLIKRK